MLTTKQLAVISNFVSSQIVKIMSQYECQVAVKQNISSLYCIDPELSVLPTCSMLVGWKLLLLSSTLC